MLLNRTFITAMKLKLHVRRSQQGAFLLEALIGILIFSLGVLGIVGLQAQAIPSPTTPNFGRKRSISPIP